MKKPWSKPELYIISQDPLQAKTINNVHEKTGHYVTLPSLGYKAFLNAGNNHAVVISSNHVRIHNLSDLLS